MRTFAYISILFNSGLTKNLKLDITKETNTSTSGKTKESRDKLDRLLHTQAPVTFEIFDKPAGAVSEYYKHEITIQRQCIAFIDVQYVEEEPMKYVHPDGSVTYEEGPSGE